MGPNTPQIQPQHATPAPDDHLQQPTCEAIVSAVASVVDKEPANLAQAVRLPNGAAVGKQVTVDATEAEGLLNLCRLSVLNPDQAPEGEIARIEYLHDKATKFDTQRVYSIQSVRRRGMELVLLENFLAEGPEGVREEDFRPIQSDSYAQQTVLNTLKDWANFRAWQLQSSGK